MSKELERLSLHRQIIQGKLAIPSNEQTQRVLRDHLRRVEGQIEAILHPVTKEQREQERFDEQEAAIWRRDSLQPSQPPARQPRTPWTPA